MRFEAFQLFKCTWFMCGRFERGHHRRCRCGNVGDPLLVDTRALITLAHNLATSGALAFAIELARKSTHGIDDVMRMHAALRTLTTTEQAEKEGA